MTISFKNYFNFTEATANAVRRKIGDDELEYVASKTRQNWEKFRSTPKFNKQSFANSKRGANLAITLSSMFKSQEPAIMALLRMTGIDPESVYTHDAMIQLSSYLDEITPEDIQSFMRSQGSEIVPDKETWKKIYGIEKLKFVRDKVEQGERLSQSEQYLYEQWKQIVNELNQGRGIVGQRYPTRGFESQGVTPDEYDSFLNGKSKFEQFMLVKENEKPFAKEIGIHPEHAYDELVKRGIEVISDNEVELKYLEKIIRDVKNGEAVRPTSGNKEESDERKFQRAVSYNTGRSAATTNIHNPETSPAFTQYVTGMTQPIEYGKDVNGKLKALRYGKHMPLPPDHANRAARGELPAPYVTTKKK